MLSLKGYPLCDFGADIPPFSVTAAVVIQWHWAESSPTEHIALHRNRYIPMLSDGDDSSETERSSFGPENILAKNSLRVSFSLLSFYHALYKKKKSVEKSIHCIHTWLTNQIRHGIYCLLFHLAFEKKKTNYYFLPVPLFLENQVDSKKSFVSLVPLKTCF